MNFENPSVEITASSRNLDEVAGWNFHLKIEMEKSTFNQVSLLDLLLSWILMFEIPIINYQQLEIYVKMLEKSRNAQ